MRSIRRSIGCQLLVVMLAVCAAPAANATGSKNVYDKFRSATYSNDGLMSQQDEVRLGEQVHNEVLRKYQIVRDPEINAYLQNLGDRLVRSSKRTDIQYRFYAIDDNSVNAFSLPGGYVYVHTGLLNLVQSEDELAGAMAHEIGHVVARHGLRNLKKAQRIAIFTGILGIGADIATGGGSAGRAAQQASILLGEGILTKNSRDFEREADYLGLYDMRAAGYDPEALVRLFQRLGQSSSAREGGGIFASHPNSKERIENTQAEIDAYIGSSASQPANGSRPRRRRTAQLSGTGDFAAMKQALASYASGSRGTYRNPNYPNQQVPNPNDPQNQPARNDRPVLTRRP